MVKPWLYLPPTFSQQMGHWFLKTAKPFQSPKTLNWSSLDWRGLHFANPLGVAGGVDKDAEYVDAWWCWGAGFVEVGTITPQPQKVNDGVTLKRDVRNEALWNRLGFPSKGVDVAVENLKNLKRPYHTPIFANIGKNRDTSLENASADYAYCLKKLDGLADAFVVNISSPNTAQLRELQKPEGLKAFLNPIFFANKNKKPILLKLAPDLEESSLREILDVTHELGIDGWILTNTTLSRPGELNFPTEGGMSGKPLAPLSREILKTTVKHLGLRAKGKLIVSCGGAMTADEVKTRLDLGANLVQVYSALVFQGPRFFAKVAKRHE